MEFDSNAFIAAIGQCQTSLSAKRMWSGYPFKPKCQSEFEKSVAKAVEQIAEDNPYYNVEVGEIAAISALNHKPGSYGLDIRPKVYDSKEKAWVLLDSGSCVSCIPKKPGDKIDPSFKLKAVNGGSIPTFGSEEISIRIGRKEYSIQAVKVDIPQRILGWDFFRKHSLGFDWNDFGDLLLIDKKNGISSTLKCFKIPSESVQSVEYEEVYSEPHITTPSSAQVYFETNCMKALDASSETFVHAMSIASEESGPVCDNLPLSKTDPDADHDEKENLKLLEKLPEKYKKLIQEFPAILKNSFRQNPAEGIFHSIETEGPAFKSKVRPLLANSEKFEAGRKIWKEMEELGVIERVKPNTLIQYTSPLHMVQKPNKRGWRICADFRKLNQITKIDNYPLPILRSFQSTIKGSKVFSIVDIKSAFHHLPIDPKDVNKTCVLSPWGGAFVFKRLAFGLCNGPATWQKYIDSIVSDIPGLFCYLDDLLICSEDVESHLSVLKTLFQRLNANGLTLALDKCEFGRSSVDYLGYHVTSTGIRPLRRKVDAINKIPVPKTQKALLQFLGALNYFRASLSGFVKRGRYHNAANLLQPLYSAATVPIKAQKFEEIWQNSPILQEAFEDAKKLLIQAAELSHPDPTLPLALMCDASDHSIGSVLLQQSKSGKWTPLGYMSKHLSVDKCRWSTCRKELLAAQSGLRYFINEIYGRHCIIYSDHAPLVLAFKNPLGFQLHDPVAQRALMEIGQFTKDIRHIAGKQNVGSDFLSRIPSELKGSAYDEICSASVEGHKLECLSPKVLKEAQENCAETKKITAGLHPPSLEFKQVKFEDQEIWCETSMSKPRPFLPVELRKFVLKNMHFAHNGVKETVRVISSHYYWHELRTEVTKFVQTCHGCQSQKSSKITPPHYGKFEVPDQRFTHCHVDIVGPLPKSEGYKYLLTIIDRTTRHLSALPLVEPSAKECSQAFLLHYVAQYGLPSACTSDQGSNFVSSLFTEMQRNLGIDIKHTPVYWPQGNGLIERNHQSLKDSIKAQLVEMGELHQENWMKYLPWALLGRRTAYNKDLGTSSSELTLGTHIQVPGSLLQPVSSEEPNINQILNKLRIKDNRAAVPTSTIKQEEKEAPKNVTHVYVKQHNTRGLDTRYRGPFEVISQPSRSTLQIKTGLTKNGEIRSELRSWSDCKPAHLRDDAVVAERPKRGRPPKTPEPSLDVNPNTSTSVNNPSEPSANNQSETRKYNLRPRKPAEVAAIDFTKPPPNAGNLNNSTTSADPPRPWSASEAEIKLINQSIQRHLVKV